MASSIAFYVYALLCRGGSYYVGVTADKNRRIREHFEGRGPHFTRQFPPIEVAYVQSFSTREEAAAWERQLKGWRRDKKQWIFKLLYEQARKDEEDDTSPI
jgi:putative endonuclease